jgi:hypothetical protein
MVDVEFDVGYRFLGAREEKEDMEVAVTLWLGTIYF